MKCLSIREPWLTLILLGKKDYEFRGWTTDYTGLLALHSSKTYGRMERETADILLEDGLLEPRNIAVMKRWLGHIRGVTMLEGVLDVTSMFTGLPPNGGLDWDLDKCPGLPDGWPEEQTYGWELYRERLLARPIPYKGQLGLFEVPDDMISDAGVARWWKEST